MASDEIGWKDWQLELFSRVPLHVVMRDARKNPETGRWKMENMAFVVVGDEELLPVFTEKKLADSFLINTGAPEGKIMAFDKTGEFKKFLTGLDQSSFDGIVFDPGHEVGGRVSYYPLDQAIEILKYLESHA